MSAGPVAIATDIIARLEAALDGDAPIRLPLAPHEKGKNLALQLVARYFKETGTIGIPPGEPDVLLFTPITIVAVSAEPTLVDALSVSETANQLVWMGALPSTTDGIHHCACGFTCSIDADLHSHLVERHYVQPPPAPIFQCARCPLAFNTRDELMGHADAAHPPVSIYPCSQCAIACDTHGALVEHMGTAHPPAFDCGRCALSFGTRDELVAHTDAAHPPVAIYPCSQCAIVCGTRDELVGHTDMAHPHVAIYPCSHCAIACDTRAALAEHLRAVHPPMFDCGHCALSFGTRDELLEHADAAHQPTATHSCPICTDTFDECGELVKHVRIRHPLDKLYQCRACAKCVVGAARYIEHVHRHHVVPPVFPCGHCERVCNTLDELRDHTQTTHARTYPCTLCAETFVNNVRLIQHVRLRHAVRHIYRCALCAFEGQELLALQEHTRDEHTCSSCHMVFDSPLALAAHRLEKHARFPCAHCDKTFGRVDNRNRHVQAEHPEHVTVHACALCGKTCFSRQALLHHRGAMHRDTQGTKRPRGGTTAPPPRPLKS
jgi:hypothetical protein